MELTSHVEKAELRVQLVKILGHLIPILNTMNLIWPKRGQKKLNEIT